MILRVRSRIILTRWYEKYGSTLRARKRGAGLTKPLMAGRAAGRTWLPIRLIRPFWDRAERKVSP